MKAPHFTATLYADTGACGAVLTLPGVDTTIAPDVVMYEGRAYTFVSRTGAQRDGRAGLRLTYRGARLYTAPAAAGGVP